MIEADAILTACVFLLDHGEDPESDYGLPSAELCPVANVGAKPWDGGYGQDAAFTRTLRARESRDTWRIDFWDNKNWLPPGWEAFPTVIHVWVDDPTGEAWWVEDGQPTQTSWRQK